MVYGTKPIAPNRYRENLGRDYEDFEVGDVYEHRPGRTLLQADNAWFTLLTMNTHPVHFDVHHASQTEFGKPLMNSTLTLAVITGMSVSDTSQRAIANLGWDRVRLLAPVFEGDTLYAESEVLTKRLSKSRPGQGIVTIETTGFNQNDAAVITFERSFLIAQGNHATVSRASKSRR